MMVACDRLASDFQSNTEHGRLRLTVVRAVNTTQENVTEIRINEQLRYMLPVLARILPLGVEIHVDAAASSFGMYRYGAGWITSGELHFGQHAVMTETVEIISSDVNILTAELMPNPADHKRHQARLVTLNPGTVRLTFKTSKLDKRMHRLDALIEDSIVLTVAERPGIQGVL